MVIGIVFVFVFAFAAAFAVAVAFASAFAFLSGRVSGEFDDESMNRLRRDLGNEWKGGRA